MLASGLCSCLQLALLLPVLVDRDPLSLVHDLPKTRVAGGLGIRSCGGWIRTNDLRVMSPTSCRCSTPRRKVYAAWLSSNSSLSPQQSSDSSLSRGERARVRASRGAEG